MHFTLNILCNFYRFFQCAKFVIHLLKFVFFFRGYHHTGTGLIKQRIVFAQKRTNHNRMVHLAIETKVADCTAIVARITSYNVCYTKLLREAGIKQTIDLGLGNKLSYALQAGSFTNNERVHFSEYRHFSTAPLLVSMSNECDFYLLV